MADGEEDGERDRERDSALVKKEVKKMVSDVSKASTTFCFSASKI